MRNDQSLEKICTYFSFRQPLPLSIDETNNDGIKNEYM